MGADVDDRSLAATPGGPPSPVVRFDTHPDAYRHWRLEFPPEHGGAVARLVLDVREKESLFPGHPLKLNSYDLGVDLELADALQRVRFEHPAVRALVFASGKERVFSSGANIHMLAASAHAFKVNFCKFTNETRIALEEMSAETGIASLAALEGTASGGGYELALACDEILLSDDGASAVSLPEAPLLGVLPGTGGLTRLVDKRLVRRDLADVFCTTAEGVRGRRAAEWGLVDAAPGRKEFAGALRQRLDAMIARSRRRPASRPMPLAPLDPLRSESGAEYRFVSLALDARRRVASLTVRGPDEDSPRSADAFAEAGSSTWAVRVWRELDDALLDLRFNHPAIGVVALRTQGDPERVLAVDRLLATSDDALVVEARLLARRVLKRLDLTARSVFAFIEPGSCFAGSLFELALAADRSYMLEPPDGRNAVQLSGLSAGLLPMSNGASRLGARFLRDPERLARLLGQAGPFDARAALAAGLVTFAPDDIDWDDEVRVAVEERASLSPDALTAMEANLRFGGPETLESKIFARLSAWQNWVFQRRNAVGPRGALTLYGKPERPEFDWERC